MSVQALAVALRGGELFVALKKLCAGLLSSRKERRSRRMRGRARAAALPMRPLLLRDLGLVEADARRRGLLL